MVGRDNIVNHFMLQHMQGRFYRMCCWKTKANITIETQQTKDTWTWMNQNMIKTIPSLFL